MFRGASLQAVAAAGALVRSGKDVAAGRDGFSHTATVAGDFATRQPRPPVALMSAVMTSGETWQRRLVVNGV